MHVRCESRTPAADVVVGLDNPDELFAADPRGLLAGSRRIDSGMDELVERILAQKNPTRDQRIVLDIASECTDETAATVVAAVRRYCELRQLRAHREHDLIWRQGKRALLNGSFLFIVGIALSYLFTRDAVGEIPRDLFGYGVFLVVAWVGLWYPLDLLFIAREQARREIRVLGQMVDMPVIVRAHDRTLPMAAITGLPMAPGVMETLNARFRRFRGPSSSRR